jgi:hypothetical protein
MLHRALVAAPNIFLLSLRGLAQVTPLNSLSFQERASGEVAGNPHPEYRKDLPRASSQ